MPCCYIKNCTNRMRSNYIKFFKFPKEPVVHQQWLEACGKQKGELPKSATICSIHFEEDCFQWMKPRQNNISPNQIYRLKENSVPTKLLKMEEKRKNDNKRIKIGTGIPTYGELVQHAQKKQYVLSDETICIDANISEDKSVFLSDVAIKEIMECSVNAAGEWFSLLNALICKDMDRATDEILLKTDNLTGVRVRVNIEVIKSKKLIMLH